MLNWNYLGLNELEKIKKFNFFYWILIYSELWYF